MSKSQEFPNVFRKSSELRVFRGLACKMTLSRKDWRSKFFCATNRALLLSTIRHETSSPISVEES